jgi:ketosteroid isomerase-like protein
MTYASLAKRIVVTFALIGITGSVQAGTEDEVKTLFSKFIAAQNAHDLKAVGEILQDSPGFLWITRNTPIWGREAALKRFAENYEGTWLLEAKFEEITVVELAPGVAQLFVPAVFTIAPPGQAAQPRRFLLTQLYVKERDGWKISTILPFPVP